MKLPHWVLVACGLATVVLAYLMKEQASGDIMLPAAAVAALSIVQTVLGLLSTDVRQAP